MLLLCASGIHPSIAGTPSQCWERTCPRCSCITLWPCMLQEQVVAGFRDDIMEQRAFTVRLMLRKGNRAPMHLAFR